MNRTKPTLSAESATLNTGKSYPNILKSKKSITPLILILSIKFPCIPLFYAIWRNRVILPITVPSDRGSIHNRPTIDNNHQFQR